jgi:hypothetical protein
VIAGEPPTREVSSSFLIPDYGSPKDPKSAKAFSPKFNPCYIVLRKEPEEGVGSEGIHHCNNKCKATVVDFNLNPLFKFPS